MPANLEITAIARQCNAIGTFSPETINIHTNHSMEELDRLTEGARPLWLFNLLREAGYQVNHILMIKILGQ